MLVEPSQTLLFPLIEQLGTGLTVTDLVQELVHPFLEMLSVSVNEPLVPAVTDTLAPSVAPLIVPLPDMLQL